MDRSILFLCCCSNRKLAGGESFYRSDDSLPVALGSQGTRLLRARRRALQRIQDGAASVQGTRLQALPYNGELVDGRDFGGRKAGIYMPAVKRYRGRFYQEFDPDESGALDGGPHRWLIVSALYGLVAPNEQIQRYSCHTLDEDGITSIWKGALLTSLLLQYVKTFDVGMIVDLLADESYHELFNWERIAKRDIRVLRAFGEQNVVGPALLPALGFLARNTLANLPAGELFGIDEHSWFRTDYEDVVLTTNSAPPFEIRGEPAPKSALDPDGDEEVTETVPGSADVDVEEGCFILPHARAIPVTSNHHRTILGHRVSNIRDLPPEVRGFFDTVSRAVEVLSVTLGPTSGNGHRRTFALTVARPRPADGKIDGKLTGPGKRGTTQHLRIQVTPGREVATYMTLTRLMSGEIQ